MNESNEIVSELAKELNLQNLSYLAEGQTYGGTNSVVVERINRLWWPNYLTMASKNRKDAINKLDLAMGGPGPLRNEARSFCLESGEIEGTPRFIQRFNQFLKSNTGKMFERLIIFSISENLLHHDSDFVCLPYVKSVKELMSEDPNIFNINVTLGEKNFFSDLDADAVVFNPENPLDNEIYFLTMKSTLKDRLHSAIFLNLLRYVALGDSQERVTSNSPEILHRLNYVLVCTVLAEEQPDLNSEDGPICMIGLDVALLDGAFVTGDTVKAVGNEGPFFGKGRSHPFHWLSRFIDMLT